MCKHQRLYKDRKKTRTYQIHNTQNKQTYCCHAEFSSQSQYLILCTLTTQSTKLLDICCSAVISVHSSTLEKSITLGESRDRQNLMLCLAQLHAWIGHIHSERETQKSPSETLWVQQAVISIILHIGVPAHNRNFSPIPLSL